MTDRTLASPRSLSPARIVALVFLPFALGYFLSYLYRNVNAVAGPAIAGELGVDKAALGALTSAYFLAFASFQLPLGVLLDRYGPRRVEAALLLFAAAGAALFAMGDGLTSLTVGRALIGLGVSACLMAALKANVMWWPTEKLPLVNGLFMACGGLGAVAATAPVQAAIGAIGWRGLFLGLAGLTLAAAALIYVVTPEPAKDSGGLTSWRVQALGALKIFRSGDFWDIAPAGLLIQGGFLAYLGLWAGPWLREVQDLSEAAAADALLWVAVAQTAGFVAIGAVAERLGRLGVPNWATAAGVMAAFVAAEALLLFGIGGVLGPWIAFGFLSTGSVLSYALLSQRFPAEMAGRANTALNLLVFLAAFALQWSVGVAIDALAARGWSVEDAHRAALAATTLAQAAALGWLILARRVRRRPAA